MQVLVSSGGHSITVGMMSILELDVVDLMVMVVQENASNLK